MKERLAGWLRADPFRCRALELAATLALPDWCLGAGFLRNLAWDRLHGYTEPTALSDLDLVYFDPSDASWQRDRQLEGRLEALAPLGWSVKNQARMHLRNGDAPYVDTSDAMAHWVEVETAVGVRWTPEGEFEFVAPFGLEALGSLTITPNAHRPKPEAFAARVTGKRWLEIWPRLQVASTV